MAFDSINEKNDDLCEKLAMILRWFLRNESCQTILIY